jgi:Glycosyltransferases involved in cell wall biogenesis
MRDLVSVVIPVYNVEAYLPHCINSVRNQSYTNLEIILVDDGSTDSSGAICDDFQLKDSRIKVIHKKNGGLSEARNTGIDASVGQFLFFLDGDDWLDTDCISKLYHLLQKTGSDISICNFHKVYIERIPRKKPHSQSKVFEYTNLEALEQLAGKKYMQMTVSWGKLIRRGVFNNIYFPVGKLHEDEFTTYKLLYKAKKVAVTMDRLLYYRQREGSITYGKKDFKLLFDGLEALEERARFLKSIHLEAAYHKTLYAVFKQMVGIHALAAETKEKEIAETMRVRLQELRPLLNAAKLPMKRMIIHKLYYFSPEVWLILGRFYKKIATNHSAGCSFIF